MIEQGIVLAHIVSNRGIEVDPAKIYVISQLPYPSCMREVRSFLGHALSAILNRLARISDFRLSVGFSRSANGLKRCA